VGAQEFDVIVYGATGFTGRLVAEYLQQTYGTEGEVRWAMAGRDITKLRTISSQIGAPMSLTLIAADAAPISFMANHCWRPACAPARTT
jgi:short subunit dehydrogenase-like uncharacterized protein